MYPVINLTKINNIHSFIEDIFEYRIPWYELTEKQKILFKFFYMKFFGIGIMFSVYLQIQSLELRENYSKDLYTVPNPKYQLQYTFSKNSVCGN